MSVFISGASLAEMFTETWLAMIGKTKTQTFSLLVTQNSANPIYSQEEDEENKEGAERGGSGIHFWALLITFGLRERLAEMEKE